jgi:hypothetical protein
MNDKTYKGHCFCGAVEVSVTGSPVAMGYCHCTSCRSWSAAPINAFSLWKPEQVNVTKGKENIEAFHKTEKSHRQFCRACGGHLMTQHPTWGLIDVYTAIIPDLPFEPKLHVHYGEKVVSLRDGLPKFENVPQEMGGSGKTMSE